MAETINLVEQLLARGRSLAACGRRTEARVTLERLLAFANLDPSARVEAHLLLADIHQESHRFRKARRQLAAVLALRPADPAVHHRLGVAFDLDPSAKPRSAFKAFARALELSPKEPTYWSALGQSALRLGRRKTALRAFRRACTLAPTDVKVLDEIAEGLTTLGREEEAGALLATARFRMPRDPGLERLWNQFRFASLRRRQASSRTGAAAGDRAVLLPFVAAALAGSKRFGDGVIRDDRFSKAAPHLHRLSVSRSDPRHAP